MSQEQVDVDLRQNGPLTFGSHTAVPHAQLALLAAVPLVMVQVGTALQRSSFDTSQMSPVADVQAPEAPQTQGAGLAVAPSPWAQAGPVKEHRQASDKKSQERVEAVSVLKYRLPPLLLLLTSKHPRGAYDSDQVSAVVSDQPTCPAAAWHVAASAIHPYPLSAHVPEVTMGYTVV